MSRRRRKPVRRRKKTSSGRIYVAVIMLFIIGVMSVQIYRLHEKDKALKKKEKYLQTELDKANEKSDELKEYEEYVGSDEYREDEASQKLGLTHDNWIIFKQK